MDRASIDGTGAQPNFIGPEPNQVCGVAIDSTEIYWTKQNAGASVAQISMRDIGGGITGTLSGEAALGERPRGIAVDAAPPSSRGRS